MKIRCPQCGKEIEYEGNAFRPFCSRRCKLLDLGEWLSGSYSVPVVEDENRDPVEPEEESADK